MSTSQQLFEINKRINQIKRNLQSRQQKAQQWSVPYQKILNKPALTQTLQAFFTKTHSGNPTIQKQKNLVTFKTKSQRRIFFQNKVKQSRKKINLFHNQLKQLQQLQQRKTKLHVQKQKSQKTQLCQQESNHQQKTSNPQIKTFKKMFTNSLMMTSSKHSFQNNTIRTLKERVNPFFGLKAEKIIELYQEAKYLGKQNFVNQSLGMGIDFTPYSILKQQNKRDDQTDLKIFGENTSTINQISLTQRIDPLHKRKQKSNKLEKALNEKTQQKKDIYLNRVQPLGGNEFQNKQKGNIFQQRMKKLIQEAQKFEECQGNYAQMLKKCRNKQKISYLRKGSYKVQANNTYQAVFDGFDVK